MFNIKQSTNSRIACLCVAAKTIKRPQNLTHSNCIIFFPYIHVQSYHRNQSLGFRHSATYNNVGKYTSNHKIYLPSLLNILLLETRVFRTRYSVYPWLYSNTHANGNAIMLPRERRTYNTTLLFIIHIIIYCT